MARRLTGTHASSLALHPAIYFYSSNGRHQPTAVLAFTVLVKHLEDERLLNEFTSVRHLFEDFLTENKGFINQLTTQYGSMTKGYRQLKDYLLFVLNLFIQGSSGSEVLEALSLSDKYQKLVKYSPVLAQSANGFSKSLRQWKFLKDALAVSFTCCICGSKLNARTSTMDHKKDLKHGGKDAGDNAQWAHPYCNSTFKDAAAKLAQSADMTRVSRS